MTETHKHNEEQEIDTYVTKMKHIKKNITPLYEVAVVPEMGQTQSWSKSPALQRSVETTENFLKSKAADAEIKRLQLRPVALADTAEYT